MKNELGALMLWIDRKLNRNQDVLVTKIDSIQNLFETSSEASASAADILEGKTAFNGTVLMTGIMENQGAKEATLLAGGTYNIPRGYHDGAGRVMATDLASQTPGTADAGGILSGLKAWVAGKLIDGAMKDRRGVTVTAASVAQDNEYTYLTIPEEGCYDANSKVRTINSNIEKIPGGNAGAPIYQGAANAGWNQWSGSRSLSYTFTKDYPAVMVYASGGCSGYGLSSSEDQVKASMYCNLYPGGATVSCTGGIITKKNNYYIIKNVKANNVVTVSFSPGGTQEVAVQAVIWEL